MNLIVSLTGRFAVPASCVSLCCACNSEWYVYTYIYQVTKLSILNKRHGKDKTSDYLFPELEVRTICDTFWPSSPTWCLKQTKTEITMFCAQLGLCNKWLWSCYTCYFSARLKNSQKHGNWIHNGEVKLRAFSSITGVIFLVCVCQALRGFNGASAKVKVPLKCFLPSFLLSNRFINHFVLLRFVIFFSTVQCRTANKMRNESLYLGHLVLKEFLLSQQPKSVLFIR